MGDQPARLPAGRHGEPKPRSQSVNGGSLLALLEQGWAPLPSKTLFALVVGGLRVRMMRSIVTMVSIVLAIAFLSYTGFTSRLQRNLATRAKELDDFAPVEAGRAADAAEGAGQLDLFGALSPGARRKVAVELGLADAGDQAAELARLAGELARARADGDEAAKELRGLTGDAGAIAADLEAARAKLRDAEERAGRLSERRRRLAADVETAQLLSGGDGALDARSGERILRALEARKRAILTKAARPARLTGGELDRAELLLSLAELRPGAAEPVRVLRRVIDGERRRRLAAELRTRLRRAGVSVRATIEGSDIDTWLITMALLTCAVGIANAMLMSVTERFREIGTMKCLGAEDSLVVKLFLMESAMLGLVGALMGVVLGLAVALAAAGAQFGGWGVTLFPLARGLSVVGWSLLGGLVLAVAGGVYPSIVAARMQPVDALRVDE